MSWEADPTTARLADHRRPRAGSGSRARCLASGLAVFYAHAPRPRVASLRREALATDCRSSRGFSWSLASQVRTVFSFRLGGGNGGCMSAPSLPLHVSSAPRSLASPLRPVGRETWWTLPCASCRVPSTRGVFSRTLLWKTGALALSSSFTRGKGRYGHLGVDAGFICTSGSFPYRSSFLPARSTHLRPFGRVTRQTFPSALGLGTVCLALVPLALPLCANPGGTGGRGKSGLSGGSRRGGNCAPLCFGWRECDP